MCRLNIVVSTEPSPPLNEPGWADWCDDAADNLLHGTHISEAGAKEILQRILVHPPPLHAVPGLAHHSSTQVGRVFNCKVYLLLTIAKLQRTLNSDGNLGKPQS